MATSALPLTTQDAPAPAPPPRFVPFEDPAAVQAATERYLVGDEISSRAGAGGQSVHYVECWRAIQAANRIFGFNGWSSDIVSLEKEFMGPEKDGKWVAMYSAVVRVELKDGTSHTETGSGDAKDRDRAKAVENARKEAVSDATKRALRAFGNALGNCVYDKAHCKENEAAKKAAAKRAALAAAPQPQPPQFQQPPQQWQQQPPPGAALAGSGRPAPPTRPRCRRARPRSADGRAAAARRRGAPAVPAAAAAAAAGLPAAVSADGAAATGAAPTAPAAAPGAAAAGGGRWRAAAAAVRLVPAAPLARRRMDRRPAR